MDKAHDLDHPFSTLTEEDREDPFAVIKVICQQDTLFNMRVKFFVLFSAAMGSNELEDDTPIMKANRMWLFRLTIQLYEAAYLIHMLQLEGRLTYDIMNKQ